MDAPERIWAERDAETNEKRWFSLSGMGTEYVRADLYAALVAGHRHRLAVENERMRSLVTNDDIWLMASAAEHLRGGSHARENRAEIAFNIASKLDELRDRIEAAALSGGKDGE